MVVIVINVNEELKRGDGKVCGPQEMGPLTDEMGLGPRCVCVNRPWTWPAHSG